MCGIIAYTGNKQASPILLEGLKHMEYRGYDSAGMCLQMSEGSQIHCTRAKGKVAELVAKVAMEAANGHRQIMEMSHMGLAHTRWATHGEATESNAHPHADCTEELYVVHNGIIENHRELRDFLEKKGHKFLSMTDTEVLAHLVEENLTSRPLQAAMRMAVSQVTGMYSFAVIWRKEPSNVYATCNSCPLQIGIAPGEHFIASDAAAFIDHTHEVVRMQDGDIAIIAPERFTLLDKDDNEITRQIETIDLPREALQLDGFDHYMAKEIHETPLAIERALSGRIPASGTEVVLDELTSGKNKKKVSDGLAGMERLIIVSCGTSYYAGLTGAMMLEEFADIPVEVLSASEFRYRKMPLHAKTVVIGISQSGETADTFAALKLASAKGLLTLGIVNVVGSNIAKKTDACIFNHAGPETSVASTKAFISQLTVLALLTVYLGRLRGTMSEVSAGTILTHLKALPSQIKSILAGEPHIKGLAAEFSKFGNFLFLGRKYQYPTALEGALKLKEVSYLHAEGYSAGEMKHGPIALISEEFPTVALMPSDSVYEKMASNIEEVKARKGPILAVVSEGNDHIASITPHVIRIPRTLDMLTPILAVVPLQLFAYHMAVLKGCDVDKPRNLAKSVTVE